MKRKKKIRKNTQLSLINSKGAGRRAVHDPGIRHTARPLIKKASALHITIKVKKIKADIKNKSVLKLLHRGIANARKQKLRIIHFTLEYDHIHLLIEADNNLILGKGMKALGVTLAKGVNRLKKQKGDVYKHRYHFRKIENLIQYKRVLNYIFTNGIKHKTANSLMNGFHSLRAERKYHLFTKISFSPDEFLIRLLDRPRLFHNKLEFLPA